MKENENEFSFQSHSYDNRNMISFEIDRVHSELIYKIKNLENVHQSMKKQKESTYLAQEMIEEFIFVCNKSKECDCAMSLIDVMKIFQEQNVMMFHSIFGQSFIAKMKSRLDVKTFKPKEMGDPEPEIPDDLEISGDSVSIKFNLRNEREFTKSGMMMDRDTQTDMKGIYNRLSLSINDEISGQLQESKEETKQGNI